MKFFITAFLALIVINGYRPSKHDRFINFPENTVANDSFAIKYDLRGLGWRKSKPEFGHVLITPKHFIGVNHSKPSVGDTLVFYESDTSQIKRSVSYIKPFPGYDFILGALDSTIHSIPHYSIPDSINVEGLPVIITGRNARATASKISGSTNKYFWFEYENVGDAMGEGGDSGSPTFFVDEAANKLKVVGIHQFLRNQFTPVRTYDLDLTLISDRIRDSLRVDGYDFTGPLFLGKIYNFNTNNHSLGVALSWSVQNDSAKVVLQKLVNNKWTTIYSGQGSGTFLDKYPTTNNYYKLTVENSEQFRYHEWVNILYSDPFPNPVRNELNFSRDQKIVTITNVFGISTIFHNVSVINMTDFPPGVYFVTTLNRTYKIVKL